MKLSITGIDYQGKTQQFQVRRLVINKSAKILPYVLTAFLRRYGIERPDSFKLGETFDIDDCKLLEDMIKTAYIAQEATESLSDIHDKSRTEHFKD